MLLLSNVVKATSGTNQTISFQARLLQASGAVVPDGYYNIQFKIYQDGAGSAVGNPGGTLKWTETYINNGGTSGVQVKNGYFSVNLGSVTSFGSSVDWNQDTLWLSMNIGGSAASCTTFGSGACTADGEMLPMKRLTAVPQALNSDKLDGKDSSDFIQNSTTPQTADFNISGAGSVGTLNAATGVSTPSIDRANAGTLSIGNVNASTIEIGTNSADHTINIGTASSGIQNVTLGSTSSTSQTRVQGGSSGIVLQSTGGFSVRDGSANNQLTVNSTGTTANLQAGDNFQINGSDGTSVISVGSDHNINIGSQSALNVAGEANFDNGITISDYSTDTQYTTPLGAHLQSAINIVNHDLGAYGSILTLGVTAASPDTARAVMVADARTTAHQPTIGVLDPTENQIFGFSWEGSNSTAYLKNTANNTTIRVGNTTDAATFSTTAVSLLQPTNISARTTVATTDANALVIQNTGATQLFKADTSAMQVIVGNSTNGVTLSASGITLNGNARGTKKITLVPEYAGAVLDSGSTGSNQGTMVSKLDLTNRLTHYRWTSSQATAQTYDVAIKVPIPQDFSVWAASNPIAVATRTSSTADGSATIGLLDTDGTVRCDISTTTLTMGSANAWITNNPSCLGSGTYTPGESIIIRVRVSAKSNANLDLGDITLTYLSNKQ